MNADRTRRRMPRRDFHKKVGVLFAGKYMVTRAIELSEGGMLVEMEQSMEIGQKLVITFGVPGALPVVVKGTIRYRLDAQGADFHGGRGGQARGSYRYGIEFLNLGFQARRDIRNYVASKSEEEYKKAVS